MICLQSQEIEVESTDCAVPETEQELQVEHSKHCIAVIWKCIFIVHIFFYVAFVVRYEVHDIRIHHKLYIYIHRRLRWSLQSVQGGEQCSKVDFGRQGSKKLSQD